MLFHWLPWRFSRESTEIAYYATRSKAWIGADQWVAVPWAFLWVTIITRHWFTLSVRAILHSAMHFLVIISPAYLRHIFGRQWYAQHRNIVIIAALLAYITHPGGGLYRDAIMESEAERTHLNAITMVVRLLVGSRMLFWLILVFGYELPPELGVPVNGLFLGAMIFLRPSLPFCKILETPLTSSLFRSIANNIPLITLLPSGRLPSEGQLADICNPLVLWIQITLGFLLPTSIQLASDIAARRHFARRRSDLLTPEEKRMWSPRNPSVNYPTWQLSVLLFTFVSSGTWYFLMWVLSMDVYR